MFFGRTELIIGPSKAKNDQESFAEVHLSVSHQNPDQNSKKQISETGKSVFCFFDVEKPNVGDRLK